MSRSGREKPVYPEPNTTAGTNKINLVWRMNLSTTDEDDEDDDDEQKEEGGNRNRKRKESEDKYHNTFETLTMSPRFY